MAMLASSADLYCYTAVSQRRIQRSYAEFCRTGTPHTPGLPGRKPVQTAKEKMLVVLWHCKKEKTGAHYAAQRLKDDGQNIICYEAYKIIQENGQITPSPAKSKRRKRVRYERKHSNSMRRADWHIMKNLRRKRLNLAAFFLDDAARRITGFGIFERATLNNASLVLRKTIREFESPIQMLSDNGRCFAAGKMG